jgi:hypothetical protein
MYLTWFTAESNIAYAYCFKIQSPQSATRELRTPTSTTKAESQEKQKECRLWNLIYCIRIDRNAMLS